MRPRSKRRLARPWPTSWPEEERTGIDVLNDGEMGKIAYATYVKERLTGFQGESSPITPGDLLDFRHWRSGTSRRPPAPVRSCAYSPHSPA